MNLFVVKLSDITLTKSCDEIVLKGVSVLPHFENSVCFPLIHCI